MAGRPCLDCGRIVIGDRRGRGTRCPACQAGRPTRTVDWAERQRRAEVVAQHRAEHGDWCPGWDRAPHISGDLTADHVVPVAAGGREDGPLQVLCRRCNGAKRDQR